MKNQESQHFYRRQKLEWLPTFRRVTSNCCGLPSKTKRFRSELSAPQLTRVSVSEGERRHWPRQIVLFSARTFQSFGGTANENPPECLT